MYYKLKYYILLYSLEWATNGISKVKVYVLRATLLCAQAFLAMMVAEAEFSLRHLTACPSRFLVFRSCQSSSSSWTAQTSLTLLPRVNSAHAQIYI